VLHQRLVEHVRAKTSDGQDDVKMDQAHSADAEVREKMGPDPPNSGNATQVCSVDNITPVLGELLGQLSTLPSEEPDTVLCLFTRLDEVYELGLVSDRVFMAHVTFGFG
jgi:hypothetical protein